MNSIYLLFIAYLFSSLPAHASSISTRGLPFGGAAGDCLILDPQGLPQWGSCIEGNAGTITTINGLTDAAQSFAISNSGLDFNIMSAAGVHTFAIPDASLSARGFLTSADWNTFNSKQDTITTGNLEGTSPLVVSSGLSKLVGGNASISIPEANGSTDGYLSSTDWNRFDAIAGTGVITSLVGDVTSVGAPIATTTLGLEVVDNTHIATNATISLSKLEHLSGDKALVSDGLGVVSESFVSTTELQQLTGVTSNIQTQLDDKLDGGGSAGLISIWGGAKTQNSNTNLSFDSVNNRVGVGTSTPEETLDLRGIQSSIRMGDIYPTYLSNGAMAFNLSPSFNYGDGSISEYASVLTHDSFTGSLNYDSTLVGGLAGSPAIVDRILELTKDGSLYLNGSNSSKFSFGLKSQSSGDGLAVEQLNLIDKNLAFRLKFNTTSGTGTHYFRNNFSNNKLEIVSKHSTDFITNTGVSSINGLSIETTGATNIKKDLVRTGIQYSNTANDTLIDGVSVNVYSCSGADCDLYFPECNATQNGRQVTVKNLDGGKNVIVTPLAGTIEQNGTFSINNGYKTATFICAFSATGLNEWLAIAKI